MQHQLKAIETRRRGYRFRSRLEARYSVFFDALPVRWEYEPEGFELPSGKYLPDFHLPDLKCWFEVKPAAVGPTSKRIYLAGKMNGWRDDLLNRGHYITGPEESAGNSHEWPGLHAAGDGSPEPDSIVKVCLSQIAESDAVFAWVSSVDTYATFAEIGFAAARGLPVHLAVADSIQGQVASKSTKFSDWNNHGAATALHDLWFIERLSTSYQIAATPQTLFDRHFGFDEDERLCDELARARGETVFLVRGDPATTGCVNEFSSYGCALRDQPLSSLSHTLNINGQTLAAAGMAARAARFEHGENGGV